MEKIFLQNLQEQAKTLYEGLCRFEYHSINKGLTDLSELVRIRRQAWLISDALQEIIGRTEGRSL